MGPMAIVVKKIQLTFIFQIIGFFLWFAAITFNDNIEVVKWLLLPLVIGHIWSMVDNRRALAIVQDKESVATIVECDTTKVVVVPRKDLYWDEIEFPDEPPDEPTSILDLLELWKNMGYHQASVPPEMVRSLVASIENLDGVEITAKSNSVFMANDNSCAVKVSIMYGTVEIAMRGQKWRML